MACSIGRAVTPSEDGLWTGARQTGAQMATEFNDTDGEEPLEEEYQPMDPP